MKYINIAAFKRELAQQTLPHVYMILSKDAFERKEVVDFLLVLLRQGDRSFEIFQGNKLLPEQLDSEIHSMGLFSQRRILLIRDADKISKPVQAIVSQFLAKPFPDVYLILETEAFNRNTNFYKEMEALAALVDIPELKPKDKMALMMTTLREKAIAAGKTIDPQVCTMMMNQLGTDSALLHNELEKLICYVGERKIIGMEDVRAMCRSIPQDTIWQLGDAIFKKDAAAALKIMRGMLSDELPFLVLLRQIRSQVQIKFQVCSILASGGSPYDIEKQFSYMKGYVLETNMKQAQEYGFESFKKAMLAIDQAELEAKNSQGSMEFLADILIIKITS